MESSTFSVVTDQLIASLWASALNCLTPHPTHTDTQIHLRYHPMGKSWIRLYPHTCTQTHPSTFLLSTTWGPSNLNPLLFLSGPGLDKGSTLNPTLSSLGPSPPLACLTPPLFLPPTTSYPRCLDTSPGLAWSLVPCLCAPGELCLNKICLPLVLSTVVEAGSDAGSEVLA